MRTLMAVMVLAPVLAWAQDESADVRASNSTPYWEGCKHIWTRQPYVHVEAPLYYPGNFTVPAPSTSSGSPSGGGGSSSGGGGSSVSGLGSGGGHPEALLVLAVVALAALPIIIYAIDSDADDLTLERFYCPEFSFTAMGGVQVGGGTGSVPVSGLGVAKVRADIGYVGAMAEMEMAPAYGGPGGLGSFSAHFLVRPKPKAHIEGAIAFGARRQTGPGGALTGVEVALPHMYVFSRDGYKKFGLELMPRVFYNQRGFDVGANLTLVVPVVDVLQARIGIGAFSHASKTQLTASAGLTANF